MKPVLAFAFVTVLSAVAAAKPTGPEPMHRAAIPDGAGWWCYVAPSSGMSACMRSETKCQELKREMGEMVQQLGQRGAAAGVEVPSFDDATACAESHEVWVRTGMAGSDWRYQASPSRDLCEHAPSWGMGMYAHESGCERWHEHEGPPDAAIVPAGKGWSCYAAGPTTICARTKDWCAIAYRISHGDGSAPACKAAKRAFVFTSGGGFHAFGDAAACAAARDDEGDASTCAAQ